MDHAASLSSRDILRYRLHGDDLAPLPGRRRVPWWFMRTTVAARRRACA